MKNHMFIFIMLIGCHLIFNTYCFAQEGPPIIGPDNPIDIKGTISFVLHTDKTYRNGGSDESFSQKLLELPGLASIVLQRDYSGIFIALQWENGGAHTGYYLLLSELPGQEKYHIRFTWDAKKGLSDGYFNGIPFRLENSRYYTPWEVKNPATQVKIPQGPNRISDLHVASRYIPKEEAVKQVPEELRGNHENILGQKNLPVPMDISGRKGKLLYTTRMNNEAGMKDWILEGPGIIEFRDEIMTMRSQIPNPADGSTGHFNYWCPENFPESFILEWEFKPLSNRGVSHLFFAATGKKGEDIFDPVLPERDGHFQQYINGEINNYYFIYFSNLRNMRTTNMATVWLTKSGNQSVMALGKIGIVPGVKKFHKMRIIKDGARMQLQVNGKVCLDFTDPGNRWGPILKGGKISFRQMAAVTAAYRNFTVWELR